MNKLPQIEEFVRQFYTIHCNSALVYHNIHHTTKVVKKAKQMADYYNLDNTDRFILLSAAWFHDCGHLFGEMEHHEEKSVAMMRLYFNDVDIDKALLPEIAACIMATKYGCKPQNILQEIICDADTYHVGTKKFMDCDQKVWQELELRTKTKIESKTEKSIQFLEKHMFFTDYCQKKLSEGKTKNHFVLNNLYEQLKTKKSY